MVVVEEGFLFLLESGNEGPGTSLDPLYEWPYGTLLIRQKYPCWLISWDLMLSHEGSTDTHLTGDMQQKEEYGLLGKFPHREAAECMCTLRCHHPTDR